MNPFDFRTAILAKHAQHVALIHFPIALYIAATLFRFLGQRTNRIVLVEAAYYNLVVAAISMFPVLTTGLLAWQFQLEGQKLKGVLLLHLVFACTSAVMIWLVWWMHFRSRQGKTPLPGYVSVLQALGVAAIVLTGHLGGFLSGVNGPS